MKPIDADRFRFNPRNHSAAMPPTVADCSRIRFRPDSPGYTFDQTARTFSYEFQGGADILWEVSSEATHVAVCSGLPDKARDSRRVAIDGHASPGR